MRAAGLNVKHCALPLVSGRCGLIAFRSDPYRAPSLHSSHTGATAAPSLRRHVRPLDRPFTLFTLESLYQLLLPLAWNPSLPSLAKIAIPITPATDIVISGSGVGEGSEGVLTDGDGRTD